MAVSGRRHRPWTTPRRHGCTILLTRAMFFFFFSLSPLMCFDLVDGSGSRRRMQGSGSAPTSHARAAFRAATGRQAEQGNGSVPYINRMSMDETRRRGNGNLDNEDDVVMRNDSTPRETAWKGHYHDLNSVNSAFFFCMDIMMLLCLLVL
ncbi:uncharacterized protein LOC123443716 isoform X2 [Hordeum vulgare subsp. vulgare]|uniref:uncharacterized protein LOC123443716 isoform X2 n=1 Tax=Hordeum vulgare subsp. vulgare TaxID=112509 RepID=UPI001D1A4F80|nr:uncharacterized protein LOC123443716 isoform X2 [Hordeum vulgare subsp. vulgare]